jgi:anti-anti-sigma regulatory factor
MNPYLPSPSRIGHTGNQDGTAEVLAHPLSTGDRGAGLARAGHAPAHLTLTRPPAWRHKLILTGRLDSRTAVELEDEIECLCEEGVTMLTLDLRQLGTIDSGGARAIAIRGAMYKGQGRDFTVIPGSPFVHHALAEAGAESLLAGDTDVLPRASFSPDSPPHGTSTSMIMNL